MESGKAIYFWKNRDTLRIEMEFSGPGKISSLRFFAGDLDVFLGKDDLKAFREYQICGFGVAISRNGTYRVEKLRDSIHFKGQSMKYAEYKKKTRRSASPDDCSLLVLNARYDLGLALGKMEMSADFRNSGAFWVAAFGRRENVLDGRMKNNISSVSLWSSRREMFFLKLSEERFEIPVLKSVFPNH